MMSIQGGLQGRIDTRIYQRKKNRPEPRRPKTRGPKDRPKIGAPKITNTLYFKNFFLQLGEFLFFFFTFFFLTYATFLRAQNFSVFL